MGKFRNQYSGARCSGSPSHHLRRRTVSRLDGSSGRLSSIRGAAATGNLCFAGSPRNLRQ